MSEYWIVTSKDYERHKSLPEALGVRDFLRRHCPDTEFFVHRCKASLHSAKHFPKVVELLRDIVADGGLSAANLDRARVLLLTVDNRREMPVAKNAPPEFRPRAAA
ncbi:MAG TPA: hypothetical protein VKR31_10360 [Rhizomicrobium sp.]|nr:hypothetical protein [Rhizomicrobium sp.]